MSIYQIQLVLNHHLHLKCTDFGWSKNNAKSFARIANKSTTRTNRISIIINKRNTIRGWRGGVRLEIHLLPVTYDSDPVPVTSNEYSNGKSDSDLNYEFFLLSLPPRPSTYLIRFLA